jgi:putative ABC transport system permease protein
VAQVADSYLGVTAYADIHYLSRLMNEEFVTSGVQLALDGDPKHQEQLYRQLRDTPAVASVTSRRDMIEQITDTLMKNQFVFIGVLITFSGTVFFGSIVNSSMVNLAERQREVATFLALGYDKWRIGNMFLRESLLVNVTGAIMGLPMGYALMVVTAWSYSDNDLIRFSVVPAAWIYLATIALALVFALMAHAIVQWNIHRMNYLEALNVKE